MLSNCNAGGDSWESPGQQGDQTSQSRRKSTLNIRWKDWCWSWSPNTLTPNAKNWLVGKDPDAGKGWGQEEKGVTQDEMVGWHHGLNGHESEQDPGDSEGHVSLACCNSWGCEESNTTEWLNNKRKIIILTRSVCVEFSMTQLFFTGNKKCYFSSGITWASFTWEFHLLF